MQLTVRGRNGNETIVSSYHYENIGYEAAKKSLKNAPCTQLAPSSMCQWPWITYTTSTIVSLQQKLQNHHLSQNQKKIGLRKDPCLVVPPPSKKAILASNTKEAVGGISKEPTIYLFRVNNGTCPCGQCACCPRSKSERSRVCLPKSSSTTVESQLESS